MFWRKAISGHQKVLHNIIYSNIRNVSVSRVLNKDHYETLGVKRDASISEIKNAYFELSKIYHPDRIAATDENLAKFQEITTAYEVLGNEHSRKLYDRGLFGDAEGGIESIDLRDPIVKFYKERHHGSKIQTLGQDDDLDAWTKQYYKEARQATIKKADIFKSSKYKKQELENPSRTVEHMLIIWFVIIFFLTINVEDSNSEKIYKQFQAWINKYF